LPAQETTAALQASGDVFAPAAPHAGASAAPKRTRDADDNASPQASALQAANAPAAGNPAGADAAVSASVGSAFAMNLPAALQAPGTSAAPLPTAGASAPALAPEVGNSEWGKALGQQVVQMGTAGHQVAELQLNPPGLGPLKITLSMNDHQLQAMFSSAHASVRAAVEAALPQLRATLAESGLSLGNTSVGAETQQQSAFSNGQDRQPERASYYRQAEMADTAAAFALRNAAEPVRTLGGLRIDTYA
jgi:flagellar hook-length control protein FliK